MIAVPGVAALSLLVDSVGSPGLVWSPSVTCSTTNRDLRDNVANLFWPQLMEVRGLLSRLEAALLPEAATFISASLCDGEDERSPSLAAVLEKPGQEQHRPDWLRIRAKLENITHSLLRVENFSRRLPVIIAGQGGQQDRDLVVSQENSLEEEQVALALEVRSVRDKIIFIFPHF